LPRRCSIVERSVYRFAAPLGSRDSSKSEGRPGPAGYGRTRGNYVRSNPRSGLDDLPARSWDFLSLPNCAPEVFVHARRHVFVVCMRDVFAYRLRVLEAVTANAAMPLVAGEYVRTPHGTFWVVFGMGHFNSVQPLISRFRPSLRCATSSLTWT
jgi:hypothetical protein